MKRRLLLLSLVFLVSSYFSIIARGAADNAVIKLDKTSYSGIGTQATVTLTAYDLNKRSNIKENVTVIAASTSDTAGIIVRLKEKSTDSGVFTGNFGFTLTDSDPVEKKLRVAYNDKITITFKDTGNDTLLTYTSRWTPSSGTVRLNRSSYIGLRSAAVVSVTDQDQNLRSKYIDTAKVRVTSGSDPRGIMLVLYETGINTGIFSGNISFAPDESDSGTGVIKINPTDEITAAYVDEETANNGAASTSTASASFQFSEAKLQTSAVNEKGTGNMLDITITDPDANNPQIRDRIIAKAGSGDRNNDLTLWLEETGFNTGIFKCRLYFNSDRTTSESLQVAPADNINFKYIDNTVPQGGSKEILKTVRWTYESTQLKMDKSTYSGYGSPAKITLICMDLNKHEDKIDYVEVEVESSSSNSIKLGLRETNADSGEFTGTVYFGRSSKRSKGIIKVAGKDAIVVTYKGEDDIYECYADWSPQNGQLTLDRKEYKGNSAPVKITVKDRDLSDNEGEKDVVKVDVKVPGAKKDVAVTLTETYNSSGTFTGTLYINGSSKRRPSIDLKPADKFEIVYTDKDTTSGNAEDRTTSAIWSGVSEARLTLDKRAYTGYDTYMTITLNDPDQNRSAATRDRLNVLVRSKSGKTNEEYTLTETGSNSGIFTLRAQLTNEVPTTSKIRVKREDEITVTFTDKEGNKNVSVNATFNVK